MAHSVAHLFLVGLTLFLDLAMMGIVIPSLINQDSWMAFALAICLGFLLLLFNGFIFSLGTRYVQKARKKPAARRRTRR